MGGALACQSQNPDVHVAPVEPIVKVTTRRSRPKAITTHRFLVTGFGPFGDLKTNPTASLVHWLEAQASSGNSADLSSINSQPNNSATWHPLDLANLQAPAQQQKTPRPHVELMCKVLKMSVNAVDELFAQLEEQQAAPVNGPSGVWGETVTLLLHLGVEGPVPGFKLENTAYNDMTFRIPDDAGYQTDSVPITPLLSLDAPLHTSIDLIQLEMRLADAGYCDELCSVSHDPGRFICNYTFYKSLEDTQTRGPSSSSSKEIVAGSRIIGDNPEGGVFYSLFVHVPPFEVVTEARQRQFLAALILALTEQLTMRTS